jgi:hypothetical protein
MRNGIVMSTVVQQKSFLRWHCFYINATRDMRNIDKGGVDKLELSCRYCGRLSSPAIKDRYRVVLYKLIIYSDVEEIPL